MKRAVLRSPNSRSRAVWTGERGRANLLLGRARATFVAENALSDLDQLTKWLAEHRE